VQLVANLARRAADSGSTERSLSPSRPTLDLQLPDGSRLTAERQTDEGYEVVAAATPAVVSVWDTINEPRYPSFKGIMAAKKKPVETLSLADLGVEAGEPTSAVLEFTPRPERSGGTKVTDEGDGGSQLVAFLATEKFV